ncbi:hypothetical protein B6D29_04125 [Microgenomates bacterium UTCPR1]|nr:MAG: hypothetical protein B6D29_04125 [Microgenomates bacterium UTCPR1]
MKLSFLTYNTLFNSGLENIEDILDIIKPDIICLQEVDTAEKNLSRMSKFGYELAGYENSFIRLGIIYGIVTYYNKNIFKIKRHRWSIKKKGVDFLDVFYNMINIILRTGRQKSFLLSDLVHLKTNKEVTVCNTHLLVFGSNVLKMKHIEHLLKSLKLKKRQRFIISGDFNYFPYKRKRLEQLFLKYGLLEATKDINQTVKFSGKKIISTFSLIQRLLIKLLHRVLRNLKVDYIFYKGVELEDTKRIEVRFSDHYPIISVFKV